MITHRPLPEKWLADHPDAPFHTADSVEAGIALAKRLAGDGLVCVTAGDLGGLWGCRTGHIVLTSGDR